MYFEVNRLAICIEKRANIFTAVLLLLSLCAISDALSEERSGVYDDWSYKCASISDSTSEQLCEISQVVSVADEGHPVEVLRLAVSRASDGKKRGYQLVALAPPGVHLPSDFGLMAGNTRLSLSRYRNCDPRGCFVVVPLTGDSIKRLRRSNEGAAYFRDLAGRAIKVTFSLKGFTKAFDRLAGDGR